MAMVRREWEKPQMSTRDYIGDLMELGKRFDAMDGAMRGYCEPTELGMKVHVNVFTASRRKLHAARIVGWGAWIDASPSFNPLTVVLDSILGEISRAQLEPPEAKIEG